MPPAMLSLLHDRFVMLTDSMVGPVRANGRCSSHKMCPDLMSPFGLIAGCLSRLVPRSRPQLSHFVALCYFHSAELAQLNTAFACSKIHRYVDQRCTDAYDGAALWLISIASCAACSIVDWQHLDQDGACLTHRSVCLLPPAGKALLKVVVNELKELAAIVSIRAGGICKKHVELFCQLPADGQVRCVAAWCAALEVLMAATVGNIQPATASPQLANDKHSSSSASRS